MLVAFTFEHGNFVPQCSLPLPAPITVSGGGSPLSVGRITTAGDVDGDGLDEIVVAGSRTIRKYELIRGEFALTAEAAVGPDSGTRHSLCFDVCIGDVNQDSTNEVLLSGVGSLPSFGHYRVNHPVTLYVCRWTSRDMADSGMTEVNSISKALRGWLQLRRCWVYTTRRIWATPGC